MACYGKAVGGISENGDTANQGHGIRDRMVQEYDQNSTEADGAEGVPRLSGRRKGKGILPAFKA